MYHTLFFLFFIFVTQTTNMSTKWQGLLFFNVRGHEFCWIWTSHLHIEIRGSVALIACCNTSTHKITLELINLSSNLSVPDNYGSVKHVFHWWRWISLLFYPSSPCDSDAARFRRRYSCHGTGLEQYPVSWYWDWTVHHGTGLGQYPVSRHWAWIVFSITVLGLGTIQYHGTGIGQWITVLGLDSIQYHGTGIGQYPVSRYWDLTVSSITVLELDTIQYNGTGIGQWITVLGVDSI